MRIPVFIIGLCFTASAAAEQRVLDDAALVAAYANKTHLSFYRRPVEEYGGLYFEETYYADGALDYYAGDVALKGFWSVANGRICFDYPETPLYAACFIVTEEGGCYYSYETDETGNAPGLSNGDWWIRAHIKGTKPQCAAGDLVS